MTNHKCPDCNRPTEGCYIRLRFNDPEVRENERCARCAKRADLEVVPPPWGIWFWKWMKEGA